jgi:hypothetical protein
MENTAEKWVADKERAIFLYHQPHHSLTWASHREQHHDEDKAASSHRRTYLVHNGHLIAL